MGDPTAEDSQDPLTWLQQWYASHCDGDWEHGEGVEISTLDNPGWRVQVDVKETSLDARTYKRSRIDRTDDDWVHSWVDGGKWHAVCGPRNLSEAIRLFKRWAEVD